MPDDVNRLSDLQIDEVSLVDKPANQHARVLLSKRDDESEDDRIKRVMETTGKDEDEVRRDLKEYESTSKSSPDASSMYVMGDDEEEDEEEPRRKKKKGKDEYEKGFFSNLVDKVLYGDSATYSDANGNISHDVAKAGPQGMNLPYGQQPMGQPAPGPQGTMPGMPGMGGAQAFPAQGGQMPGQMQSGPPLPDEVIQYIRALEQQIAEQQGQGQGQGMGQQAPGKEDSNVNPFGKRDDELNDDEVSFLQDLAKNLESDEQREAVSKAMEEVRKANMRAEEAERIAKAERDFRLNEEYVSKARSFVGLPVSPAEFGPVLKRLQENMHEDDVQMIEKALSAANETIASGGFFSEFGKRGTGASEPISKIDQKAQELVSKSENMSMEAARALVVEQDPSLYDEYLAEHESQR